MVDHHYSCTVIYGLWKTREIAGGPVTGIDHGFDNVVLIH